MRVAMSGHGSESVRVLVSVMSQRTNGMEWRCSRAVLPLESETARSLMSSAKRPLRV